MRARRDWFRGPGAIPRWIEPATWGSWGRRTGGQTEWGGAEHCLGRAPRTFVREPAPRLFSLFRRIPAAPASDVGRVRGAGWFLETLRIAIVTETLPPAQLNLQPWRYLGDLAGALQSEGHEVSVVTSTEGVQRWIGVPVERHADRYDYRSAPSLRNVLRTGRFDIGACRLTAGLFFSMPRHPPRDGFRGRLIGIFLRPLHSGRDLAKRFLDPTLAAEIRHDRHHAALYASRLLGTWSNAPAYVDRYVFLWDTDRQCGTAAGLPPSSCAVIRHPFDPFFLERGPPDLGPRLSGILSPARRRVIFTGPPEGSRGVGDMLRLAHRLPRDPATQVVLLLRDGTYSEPLIMRTRIGAHENVVVRGLLSREELRASYRVSQVAVFPYRFVRTGLVHCACAKVLESSDFSIPERALLIPGIGVRARAAPFPYVGLATAVLLLHAILVAVLPANPYRAALSFAALFAVGYCTVALIVGDTIRLSASEILAFSIRLTIFVTSFSALRGSP